MKTRGGPSDDKPPIVKKKSGFAGGDHGIDQILEDDADRANGIIVARDRVLNEGRIGIGVHEGDDRDIEAAGFGNGDGFAGGVHDHDGVWCVEGVVEGEIEVVQYDLAEMAGERYRFEPQNVVKAGLGTAGTLIPPFEYHTIKNSLQDGRSTVTLHIYGRELQKAHIFAPEGDGWYQRTVRLLGYAN